MGNALTLEESKTTNNSRKSSFDKLLERGAIKERKEPVDKTHPYYSRAHNVDRQEFKKR